MTDLQDVVARDDAWWHDTALFAVLITIAPSDGTTTATVNMVPNDITPSYEFNEQRGVNERLRVLEGTFVRSLVRAAIDSCTGSPLRDPARGDKITIPAAHPMNGDWYVENVSQDLGDSLVCTLMDKKDYQVIPTLGGV